MKYLPMLLLCVLVLSLLKKRFFDTTDYKALLAEGAIIVDVRSPSEFYGGNNFSRDADGFPEGFMVRYTHRFEVLQLHQLEWLLLDNLLVGIERHYGDPRFLIVEIIFVLILITSLVYLRFSRPLDSN